MPAEARKFKDGATQGLTLGSEVSSPNILLVPSSTTFSTITSTGDEPTMAKLKRIGVVFSAKLQGIVMAVAGLIAGILYAFGGAIYELFTGTLNSGTALAFFALIGMPLLFGLAGCVAGAIGALFYNFVAKWFGGIEIDLEQDG